jgi:hypothetical protein
VDICDVYGTTAYSIAISEKLKSLLKAAAVYKRRRNFLLFLAYSKCLPTNSSIRSEEGENKVFNMSPPYCKFTSAEKTAALAAPPPAGSAPIVAVATATTSSMDSSKQKVPVYLSRAEKVLGIRDLHRYIMGFL